MVFQRRVMLAIDRAGLVGADGATHAGSFDLSYLRCLPNAIIYAPSSGQECRDMLYSAYHEKGLTAVRYPRGEIHGMAPGQEMRQIPLGKAEVISRGSGTALLSFGTLLETAKEVAAELGATLINMRFVKPLDAELILELAGSHDLLVTIEENAVAGGAGSGVNELLSAENMTTPTLNLGLPDRYIDHGSQAQQLASCGLDTEGIIASIKSSPYYQESKPAIEPLSAKALEG